MDPMHPAVRRRPTFVRPALAAMALAFVLTSFACARPPAEAASVAAALPMLDSARLLDDVRRLAHDSMGGRGSMTPENAKARAWLVTEYRRIGLEPVGSGYEHAFAMPRRNSADSVRGGNVLGMVRGTVNAERVIVVSAHYDHVGTRNGQIHNGADDNASGTAAVLAMAAHFKAHPPRHTMIFALWDAEEMGLVGARAFVGAPPVEKTRIAANVNLDMVSRNEKGELFAAGATPYPKMRPILEALVPAAAVTLRMGHDSGGGSYDWTNQSDQGAFHAQGIPFVYFGVEDHPDYHKPTDDVERIQPGFYFRAARTIAGFVERLDAAIAGW